MGASRIKISDLVCFLTSELEKLFIFRNEKFIKYINIGIFRNEKLVNTKTYYSFKLVIKYCHCSFFFLPLFSRQVFADDDNKTFL